MKPTHTHKTISLLLAMAMTFSLAGTALGAELNTTEALADAAVSSETADSADENWDTLPVTDDSEEEAADSSAEAETDEADTEDTEAAETDEENAADAETTETEAVEEEESLVTDLETTEEDGTLVFALGENDESWVYTLDANGDLVFAFVYLEDEQQVYAADGFYLLPAGTVKVVQNGVTYTCAFAGGIYYFDENGIWQKDLDEETMSVYLTTVEEEDGDLVVEDTDSKVLAVGSSTVTQSGNTYSISSNIEFFNGKATFNSRYYYEGELYSGLFRLEEGGKLHIITDGVGKTFTGTMRIS